jgi:hypothetical protein
MSNETRRKRHRILALIAAVAVSVFVALALVFIVNYERPARAPEERPTPGPTPGQNAQPPTSPPSSHPRTPRPDAQDASCPDVQLVSIPGTWESSPQQDPLNPAQFPNALLLNVTRPLGEQFDVGRLQAYTVPYTAQFHKPFSTDNEMSYDNSRKEGTVAARKAIADMNARCPLTSYVIVGFSQGAVIAGDIAGDIGNGKGPVDEDLVLGVALIADGRRQNGVGKDAGPNPPGQGAEITLREVPLISEGGIRPFGITMTGPRDGGFGALNDRTYEICAESDLVCASPEDAFDPANAVRSIETLAGSAGNPVHALYATTQFWSVDGQPSTVWTKNWANDTIQNAPHPKHK